MTPEQLEAAARKLCEIRGKNPDAEFAQRICGYDEATKTYQREIVYDWMVCADEIRAYMEIQEAIFSVVAESLPSQQKAPIATLLNTPQPSAENLALIKSLRPAIDASQPSPENLVIVNPPKPEPVSFCICSHSYFIHTPHCLALDCDCDMYTEDTGATIEANKTP